MDGENQVQPAEVFCGYCGLSSRKDTGEWGTSPPKPDLADYNIEKPEGLSLNLPKKFRQDRWERAYEKAREKWLKVRWDDTKFCSRAHEDACKKEVLLP